MKNNYAKKNGRRKAGSWGAPRKAGKRIGNKAIRKIPVKEECK